MAIVFPTSLDSLSNPASGALLSTGHAAQHADVNDAVEALEAKVGINGSAVATSLDKRTGLLEGAPVPAWGGMLAWSSDPVALASTLAITSTQVFAVGVYLPACTVANIHVLITTGAAATNAFGALYTAAGALLSQSANGAAAVATTGLKTFALAVAQPVTAGFYYLVHWQSGATASVARVAGNSVVNGAFTPMRAATSATAATTTAPSPLGTLTSATNAYWIACS